LERTHVSHAVIGKLSLAASDISHFLFLVSYIITMHLPNVSSGEGGPS
jgi:hypothetical protein